MAGGNYAASNGIDKSTSDLAEIIDQHQADVWRYLRYLGAETSDADDLTQETFEFNPAQVVGYRLLGYENRMLETQDFNDDKKDAGEIGAGHTVTAIYEIVPVGKSIATPVVDPLKYQPTALNPAIPKPADDVAVSDELLTLKIRFKLPDGEKSSKLEFPIRDHGQSFAEATEDLKFASAVASFGNWQVNNCHHPTSPSSKALP